jgi:hypothetical protein
MKMSSTTSPANFSVNNGHSEEDPVKSDSPKSDFPDIDEDIEIFSWNVMRLR